MNAPSRIPPRTVPLRTYLRTAFASAVLAGTALAALPAAAAPQADPGPPPPREQEEADRGAPEPLSPGVLVQLGVGAAGDERILATLALTYRSSSADFILRGAVADDSDFLGPEDWVGDLAVLYGRRVRVGRTGWARIAAGPALVQRVEPGEAVDCSFFFCSYEENVSKTAGLALEADLTWAPARWLGLGVAVVADVNSLESFAGVVFRLSGGRVR